VLDLISVPPASSLSRYWTFEATARDIISGPRKFEQCGPFYRLHVPPQVTVVVAEIAIRISRPATAQSSLASDGLRPQSFRARAVPEARQTFFRAVPSREFSVIFRRQVLHLCSCCDHESSLFLFRLASAILASARSSPGSTDAARTSRTRSSISCKGRIASALVRYSFLRPSRRIVQPDVSQNAQML